MGKCGSKKRKSMFDTFNNLPDVYQGMAYIFTGLTLILYALGYIQVGITFVIIFFACYLIFVGAMKSGLYQKIMQAINKNK